MFRTFNSKDGIYLRFPHIGYRFSKFGRIKKERGIEIILRSQIFKSGVNLARIKTKGVK